MSMSLGERAKVFLSRKLLERISHLAASGDHQGMASLFEAIAALAPARYHRESFRQLAEMARKNDPFIGVFERVFSELCPNCRSKFIVNFLVHFMVLGRGIRDRKERELGIHLPNFFVVSPTMRCNLHCRGCYASDYSSSGELSFDRLDRLLSEAKELGMFFFTFSGGECFLRPDLLDLWGKHDDCYFQVYTNGTLIDDALVDRLVELGNVSPMISVEGDPERTDARRGPGAYDKILSAFERLRNRGALFGFSATFTSASAPSLLDDAFVEGMIDAGCQVGWFFQYIPVGSSPELAYMASPEERLALHRKVEEWRKRYPLFLGDFWNDGPYVDGCMGGGQRYFHVIANGDVEPCVFCHFSVDNINRKSLREVLASAFFKAIREAQPYDDDNLLRPCLIIDHPRVLREIVASTQARPTHPGAAGILGELAEGLDAYAERLKTLYDPLWEEGARERYEKSLEKEDSPEAHHRYSRRRPGAGTAPSELPR